LTRRLNVVDSESAKQVTFNQSIRSRTVTLDGDIFDPSGTLTGGSRQSAGSSALVQVQQLNELKKELTHHEQELMKINKEIEGLKITAEKFR